MRTILFLSHKELQCGVHEFGLSFAQAVSKSTMYSFHYAECSSPQEYYKIIADINPKAIIYNYYPTTMPWLTKRIIRKVHVPHIQIIHEVTQFVADSTDDSFFDFHIAADPTLLLKNPLVFKTGRLVPEYFNQFPLPAVPTIGSFGFGTFGKGFEKLISTVQNEFDKAVIRLHIPFAAFGDADGKSARTISESCKSIITKPGINISITHNFLDKQGLLNFLAQNSLNAFFYAENRGRGISSVIDAALAVQRPIAITKSFMFRHISNSYPSICIEDSSLKKILETGYKPLDKYRAEWCEANLIWDFERIIGSILAKGQKTSLEKIKNKVRRTIHKTETFIKKDAWIPTVEKGIAEEHIVKDEEARPVTLPEVRSFNRILDNQARIQYKPIIDNLYSILPEMMSRKISEANIQQAFVLDTVLRLSLQFSSPKILSIGSYDDTAAAALKKFGFPLEEIDPLINYDLNTFLSKPTTHKGSYNIVFSTSVIEHVMDDELFIGQIAQLLSPGGISVLTCDYNDHYKSNDAIPHEDFRMYTRNDLTQRLLSKATDCELIDKPNWTSEKPDFEYAHYCYTFATFVFRKKIK